MLPGFLSTRLPKQGPLIFGNSHIRMKGLESRGSERLNVWRSTGLWYIARVSRFVGVYTGLACSGGFKEA